MSIKYNKCPDCGSVRKRYMPLGNKKLCIDCYEEYAGEHGISKERENKE